MTAKKIVVIGSGAAGMTAASTARATDPQADITVITDDVDVAYSPCMIPWVLSGKYAWEDMVMHTPGWYSENRNIKVVTGTKVETVTDARDRSGKGETSVTAGGVKYEWDSLVVATGGVHFVPPVEGKDKKGVFTVKSVREGRAFQSYLTENKVKRVVVAGAGVLGLEVADGLARAGYDVTVIEMMGQVIPRIADADMAAEVQKSIEALGVRIVLGAPLQSVDGGDSVEGVTAGGKKYPCEAVLFATGVRANLAIPQQMGLDIGQLGAVAVSPSMQPYRRGRLVSGVFLAGDLVQLQSAVYPGPTMSQLGSSAVKEGRVAGANAAGAHEMMGPTTSPWVSRLGEVEIAGAGMSTGLAAWYGADVVAGSSDGLTRARYFRGAMPMKVKVLADRTTHRIVGAQIVAGEGTTGRIDWLASVVRSGTTAEAFLAEQENAYCPPTSMVSDPVVAAVRDVASKL